MCGLCGCHHLLRHMPIFSIMKGALYFMTSSESRWEEKMVLHVGCEQGNHLQLFCVISSRGATHLMFKIKKNDALRLYCFTYVFIPFLVLCKQRYRSVFFLPYMTVNKAKLGGKTLALHNTCLLHSHSDLSLCLNEVLMLNCFLIGMQVTNLCSCCHLL